MKVGLEYKKVKRTGLIPAFIASGLLAAAVPAINMSVRSGIYTTLDSPPVTILLDANWQLMAMLNILLVVAGACLMYHMEYEHNAMQRMCALPIKESGIFLGKFILMTFLCSIMLIIEAAAITFCAIHWFSPTEDITAEILKNFGYSFLLLLPAVLLSLLIASACRNMWISLGIGTICVFVATMIPTDHFVLSLFPFAMPFQIFAVTKESTARSFIIASVMEIVGIVFAEMIFLKVRRLFV